jgi:subtilisin family serine protease
MARRPFSSRTSRRTGSSRPQSFRPAVESLEDRRLMAAIGGNLPIENRFPGPIVGLPPAWSGPVTPNDTSFAFQSALHHAANDADIDAPEAWGWTTGSTRTTIAVVDTGVDYTHPDLARNIWINQGEIPGSIRNNLTDIDQDGRITFWDLNQSVNQGYLKANDVNGNGYLDGGDLIARTFRCMPDYKPGQDPNAPPDCTYIGGMADGLDNDGNGYRDDLIGWDFHGDDNNPMDGDSHGTHVAGTIGAVSNNALGVAGINWRTQIMPLRIRLAGEPSLDDILKDPSKYLRIMQEGQSQAIRAIRYAVNNGARVSNHSWGAEMSDLQAMFEDLGSDLGLYEGFDDLRRAINDAKDAGHIVVMAAGNAHRNIDRHASYPAGLGNANMITVAASTSGDQLAGFSNYGATLVDLAAPGVSIYSTVPVFGPAATATGYDHKSGTSMAAPHVTGVVGLLLSQHPSWTYQQIIDQIEGTVDVLPALEGQVKTGGRLNAFRAVTPGPWVTTPRDGSFHEIDRPVTTVGVVFNEAIRPGTFSAADVMVEYQTGPAAWIPLTVLSVTPVANSGNRQFAIAFAGNGPGTYRFTTGPEITSQTGYLMDVDRDGVGGEAGDDLHQFTVKMTMDYLKDQSPAADRARIRDFVQSIVLVPKDVMIAKVKTTMVSQIVIHYSLPMDAKAAGKAANYKLAVPGADGLLGTADDLAVAVKSARYNAKKGTLTLTPKSPLAQSQLFRLSVAAAGLVDRSKRQLDGDGDGLAGGDYLIDIARGTNVKYTDQYQNQVDLALAGGGVMELLLRPTGQAQHLRLVKTVAGQSSLSAQVTPASSVAPAPVQIGAISAPTAFVNRLPAAVEVAPIVRESAIDALFAQGDIIGKLAWKL